MKTHKLQWFKQEKPVESHPNLGDNYSFKKNNDLKCIIMIIFLNVLLTRTNSLYAMTNVRFEMIFKQRQMCTMC